MQIGVIKEIKDKEHRVALTPAGARALHQAGHAVRVQAGAGLGAGFTDGHYRDAGAAIVSVDQAWDAELVLKVKEPLAPEYHYLKDQILFTYLHLAGVTKTLTEVLLRQKTTAVAYETVEDAQGRLPLLAPMSAIAGNMAITMGNYYLAKFNNGKGIQLGTVLGTRYGKVVIIGDGVVGQHAARTADGMGAQVFLCGRQPHRATQRMRDISPHICVFESRPDIIARHLEDADLVVGQHRVLFWGILGALVTRAIFILLGAALLHRFHWVVYVFGAFLVFTGVKLLFQGESEVHPERNPVLRLFARLIPTVTGYRGARFTVVEAGRRYATPLLMVLIVVETTDVVFAVDSIPAIFAVTRDPFIVYTSNIFAILGLRALFFVLAGTMNKFHYLQVGLGLVLAFVGLKMLIADVYKVPVGISLGVIATLLAGSMIASLLRPPVAPPLPHPADHTDPVPRSTESDRC